ncbi:hypothetical protein [Burkholderia ambifaria]|uniref:hypothetical protein n=1 Tax=Burkholderia ambifaria TaxID=152480 RepID=UPI0018E0B135|nr:hypothetical protein [Burkholderia ambifaria]
MLLVLDNGEDLQKGQLIELRKGGSPLPITANVIHDVRAVGVAPSDQNQSQLAEWLSAIKNIPANARLISIDLTQHDRLKWNADSLAADLAPSSTGVWQWCASKVWLKRVVHQLKFEGAWPTDPKADATMLVTGASPPALPADITLKARISWQFMPTNAELARGHSLKDIRLSVTASDPMRGTLTVRLADRDAQWPPAEQQLDYGWVVDNCEDVFSFTLSVVMPRRWLALAVDAGDPRETDEWVRGIVRETVPVHIATQVHWLDEANFDNFAKTYANWQSAGSPAGDLSYQLLRHLSIGEVPADRRTGIGFVRVAEKSQANVLVSALQKGPEAVQVDIADQAQVLYVKAKAVPYSLKR